MTRQENIELIQYLNQSKLAMMRFLLPHCPFMLIDATLQGVDVPGTLRRQGLVLRIGENPAVIGMPDLVLEEQGWRGTISMQGFRYVTKVPWVAVSRVWLESSPLIVWPIVGEPQSEEAEVFEEHVQRAVEPEPTCASNVLQFKPKSASDLHQFKRDLMKPK